jgi:dTDP-4-dehydrorhamnose reductase
MEYESGAFDISAGYCRITALGKFIRGISQSSSHYWELLNMPGWWQRPCRFFGFNNEQTLNIETTLRPLLILGKNGTLGKAFSRICSSRNIYHVALSRQEADISKDFKSILKQYNPWAVVNATGYVNVDAAEDHPEECEMVNAVAVLNLATACEQFNIKLLNFSTDLVFDGKKQQPYLEHDPPKPLNVYGNSKWLAEGFLRKLNSTALTVRTSAFFGPWDKYNFISTTLTNLLYGEKVYATTDMVVSPTYVPHLVHASLDLLIDDESGIWHLANKGALSWYELACISARHYNISTENIVPISRQELKAKRPGFSVLASTRYGLMPPLEKALADFFHHKDSKETTATIYEAV